MFQHTCASCFSLLFPFSTLAKQITDNRVELARAILSELLKEAYVGRMYLAKLEHHCMYVYVFSKKKENWAVEDSF